MIRFNGKIFKVPLDQRWLERLHQRNVDTIQQLHQTLGLARHCETNPESPPPNARLVSVDCESGRRRSGENTIREIGISVFNVRSLSTLSIASSSISELQNSISTYNFTFETETGNCSTGKGKSYFVGDHSATVQKSEIREILHEFSTAGIKAIDVKLVGQSLSNDLAIMRNEQFSVPDAAIFDTLKIARNLSPPGTYEKHHFTLRRLLRQYKIPHRERNLHNGGNDAYFTLRLLFALAVESVEGEDLTPQQRRICSVLEALARMPLNKRPELDDKLYDREKNIRIIHRDYPLLRSTSAEMPYVPSQGWEASQASSFGNGQSVVQTNPMPRLDCWQPPSTRREQQKAIWISHWETLKLMFPEMTEEELYKFKVEKALKAEVIGFPEERDEASEILEQSQEDYNLVQASFLPPGLRSARENRKELKREAFVAEMRALRAMFPEMSGDELRKFRNSHRSKVAEILKPEELRCPEEEEHENNENNVSMPAAEDQSLVQEDPTVNSPRRDNVVLSSQW